MNADEMPQTQIEAVRYFADDQKCHDFLSAMRWPQGIRCAHCDSPDIGALVVTKAKSRSKSSPEALPKVITRRLWNCKACGNQFTIKTRTIFEDSPLGLDKWLPAVWMIVNAKNGVSSCELARSLGVTQKTAWHMGHRIREAMREGGFIMSGTVEVDETFIGGRLDNVHKRKRTGKAAAMGGHSHMSPVMGLLERKTEEKDSRVSTKILKRMRRTDMVPVILRSVKHGSEVFTDAFGSYRGLHMAYEHAFIDHAEKYVEGKVHTNGIENFWSLLKRTLKGTYVQIAPEHLHRYLDEQATRFNERKLVDGERFVSSIKRVTGRRLTYKQLTGKDPKKAG